MKVEEAREFLKQKFEEITHEIYMMDTMTMATETGYFFIHLEDGSLYFKVKEKVEEAGEW